MKIVVSPSNGDYISRWAIEGGMNKSEMDFFIRFFDSFVGRDKSYGIVGADFRAGAFRERVTYGVIELTEDDLSEAYEKIFDLARSSAIKEAGKYGIRVEEVDRDGRLVNVLRE